MYKNKKPFIDFIKGVFKSEGGRLPTLEVSTPMPEVKPCKKDISDPIYLLVEKLLANPRLLKVSTDGMIQGLYSKFYNVSVPYLKLKGHLITTTGLDSNKLIIYSLDLTSDESGYLISKLYPLYKQRYDRLTTLKDIRRVRTEKAKRIEIQKRLESL